MFGPHRNLELQLSSPNIFLSHDWPNSIERYGDVQDLLRRKRFFEPDIRAGKLGSPPLMGLLQNLKPQWWFSAHMHARFEATFNHTPEIPIRAPQAASPPPPQPVENPDEIVIDDDEFDEFATTASAVPHTPPREAPSGNPDEIQLDDEEVEVEAPPQAPAQPMVTNFLALDKCLPKRDFLEVIDFETPISKPGVTLSFDPEWLAISKAFHPWLSRTKFQRPFPDEAEARAMIAKELEWVNANIKKNKDGVIPVDAWQTFAMTAPGPGSEGADKFKQRKYMHLRRGLDDRAPELINFFNNAAQLYPNPQTAAFCKMLNIPDKISS